MSEFTDNSINLAQRQVYLKVLIEQEDYVEITKIIQRYIRQKETQRKKYREAKSCEQSTNKPKDPPVMRVMETCFLTKKEVNDMCEI